MRLYFINAIQIYILRYMFHNWIVALNPKCDFEYLDSLLLVNVNKIIEHTSTLS